MNALRRRILTEPEKVQASRGLRAGRIHAARQCLPPDGDSRAEVPEPLKIWYALKGFYVEREVNDFGLNPLPRPRRRGQPGIQAPKTAVPVHRVPSSPEERDDRPDEVREGSRCVTMSGPVPDPGRRNRGSSRKAAGPSPRRLAERLGYAFALWLAEREGTTSDKLTFAVGRDARPHGRRRFCPGAHPRADRGRLRRATTRGLPPPPLCT